MPLIRSLRAAALVVVVMVVASSCASRGDDDSEAAASDDRGQTEEQADEPVALEATGTGVTEDTIRVAVIADVDNAFSPGLFKIAHDGAKAWEAYVNDRGGLAGRQVRLDVLDSKLSPDEYRNSVISACDRDLAIIGTIAVFDSATDELNACGIPDLPSNPISAEHRQSANTFSVNPAKLGTETVGGYRWYMDNIEGCCRSAVLIPNQPIARESTIQLMNAADEIGFDQVYDTEVGAEERNYTPIALALKEAGVTYVRNGVDYAGTVRLRNEARIQGLDDQVLVWDCTIQCYTPDLIAEGGDAVEGQYVQLGHVPFEESEEIETLAAYLEYVEKVGGGRGSFGLNAFAAGLLLEEAVEAVVDANGPNAITRETVLAAMEDIHDFTGGGIYGETDIGNKEPSGCFAIVQVQDGSFTRIHPAGTGTLDCGPENLHETHVVEPGGR